MTVNKCDNTNRNYENSQSSSEYTGKKRFLLLNIIRILDMGCGFGSFTKYYTKTGAESIMSVLTQRIWASRFMKPLTLLHQKNI